MKYVPRVLRYVLPYKRLAAGSVAITVLTALLGLLQPWPLKFIVDQVLGGEPLPPSVAGWLGPFADATSVLLVGAVVAGLAVTIVMHVLHILASYVDTKLEQRLVLDFRG